MIEVKFLRALVANERNANVLCREKLTLFLLTFPVIPSKGPAIIS